MAADALIGGPLAVHTITLQPKSLSNLPQMEHMMSDFLNLPECADLPERKEPPTMFEYVAAELWVRECYGNYFRTQQPIPQLITWQLERFFKNYDPHDPVLELVMTIIERDFHNVLNPRLVKKFYALLKAKAPESELLALLKEIGPGGARKPDMLGISANRTLIFDGLEVGTVKGAKGTYDELHHKLDIIKDIVVPQLKIELPQLAIRLSKGLRSMSVPNDVTVNGSSFRLAPSQRILPLPVRISGSGKARYADWICYHPTMTWQLPGSSPPGPNAAQGTDGLVIYHIHRTPLPNLPETVKRHVERELERWKRQQGLILELNPALAYAFKQSRSEWEPETRRLFAYFGVGVLLLACVVVAWEVGLIAGGAALAEEGLVTLAASPQVLNSALQGSVQGASRLWPAVVGAAPLLPMPSQL
jgi:hypothetical protein